MTDSQPKPGEYVRPAKPPKPRVALVGFCANTRHMAPYNEPDVEIWGLNKGWVFMPRADRWFETHSKAIYKWEIRRPDRHVQWLKAFPGPIYMHEHDPDIPNTVAYPIKAVAEDVMPASVFRWMMAGGAGSAGLYDAQGQRVLEPQQRNPYLTSSIAMQVALAIHERFEQIELYGIDLNTGGEYAWQKPGVEYLLGIAASRGMTVIIPDDAALLKGKIYGRGFLKPEGEAITKTQYETRLAEVRAEREAVAKQFFEITGARKELLWVLEQMPPGLNHEKLHQRLQEMNQAIDQIQSRANQLAGAEREVLYWVSTTPEGQSGRDAIAQIEAMDNTPEKYDVLSDGEAA